MATEEFSNLFSALFNCFLIILFGYGAGRFNLINSTQGHGISTFIGVFSLPALLFKSMVELKLDVVNWPFLLSILLAKATVFITVIILTLLISRKSILGSAALFAIFATQSNDFALGYPIVKVLYGSTHPELLQYIYLIAPISLLILNPIGFLLLEIDKQKRLQIESRIIEEEINSSCQQCTSSGICSNSNVLIQTNENLVLNSKKKLIIRVVKGLLFNPIVFMVFLGLAFHFIFKGVIPGLLTEVLSMLSSAFSGAALFYLGLSMVGKVANQTGIGILIPIALIAAKILLLPILARQYTVALSNVFGHQDFVVTASLNTTTQHVHTNGTYTNILANYGFVYGTFPTAPSVIIYAAKYGLETDKLATGMVVCTILSAPIMYVSAWSLTIPHMRENYYKSQVVVTDRDISIIGFLCAMWCIALFLLSKKYKRVPHFITLALTIAMLICAIFTVVIDTTHIQAYTEKVILFAIFYCGVNITRTLSSSLAISIVILKYKGEKTVWKFGWLFIGVPVLFSIVITLIVVLLGKNDGKLLNPVFLFGQLQDIISFTILIITTLTTIICLIILFRFPNVFEDAPIPHYYSLLDSNSEASEDTIPLTDNDISSENSTSDEGDVEVVVQSSQITRHIILLLFLCLSMIIGVMLTGWRLMSPQSGVFFEISFLDSVFNFGQAFFVFVLFGLDSELIIDPFMKTLRKLCCGKDLLQIPLNEVDKEVLKNCYVFTKHHLEKCKRDLLHTERHGIRTYRNVLRGSDLCCWLVEVGLVKDRREAVQYGKQLMLGRVLIHVKKQHYFYDNNYLYKFETKEERLNTGLPSSLSKQIGKKDNRSSNTEGCRRLQTPCFSFERYLTDRDINEFMVASPRRNRTGIVHNHSSNKPTTSSDNLLTSDIEQCQQTLDRATNSLVSGSSAPRVVKALVRPKTMDTETSLLDW